MERKAATPKPLKNSKLDLGPPEDSEATDDAADDSGTKLGEYQTEKWAKERFRHKTIGEAKLAVMREVDYCKKVKASGLGYTYAGETQLLHVLRPSMVRHGISIAPVDMNILESSILTTSNKKMMQLVRISARFEFRYALDGLPDVTERVMTLGEAADTMDKAVNKAMTCALKYALRQSFLIETGDDADRFASQDIVEIGQGEKVRREAILKFQGAIGTAMSEGALNNLEEAVKSPGRNFTSTEIEHLMGWIQSRGKQLAINETKGT